MTERVPRRAAAAGLSLAAAVTLLAAGSAGAPGAGAAAPTVPGVTAKTITVGQIDDISAPVPGLFAGAKAGAQAYFAYVNSQGGVDGRKLVLDTHDSAFSAGTVTNEAQTIAKQDFAMVGGFSLIDGAEQSAIDTAKLPDVSEPLTPSLFTDPNVYSAVPQVTGGEASGPYKWLASKYPADVKALGIIGDNSTASVVANEKAYQGMTESLGYKWQYYRDASYTETTFLPDVLKMKAAGVKMVFLPTQQAPYIATIVQEMKQQNFDVLTLTGLDAYDQGFQPGTAGNGTLMVGAYALYMGQDAKSVPAVATFDRWVKKTDPSSKLDVYTVDAWINAELFVQALKAAGPDPTRASLDAQLDKVTSFDAGGLIATQDPARKVPGQCWLVARYENGTWHRIAPDPKSGFVCSPKGFYPTSYKGIAR